MKTKFTYFILAFSFLLLWTESKAQLNYLPGGFTTTTGTYVDLGTNGAPISVSNTDDAFSTPLPIGFTFNFNGAPYDSFIFSTNGFIKLGKDTPSRHFLFTTHAQPPANGPFTSTTSPTPAGKDTSMLFAFGQDLFAGTLASEFRFYTSGSPGTQVTTIQWKNVKDKIQATVGGLWDTINFQIKLYEGTNVVEYQYGKWTSTVSNPVARFSAVGIVGNSMTTANQNMHLVKGSTVVWSGAVANTGFYINNAVNYRNPTSSPAGPAPDNGRTYTFTPLTLNDASVRAIYAQGKVALPYYQPDSIRANISNTGLNAITSLVVTLNISGANSYTTTATIASLAANANVNVSFAPFYPTSLGANLINVSVPTDDNNANNSKNYGLSVSNTRNAYTDTLIPSSGGNGTTIPNFWGAKYFVSGSGMVTQVRSPLASNSEAINDTVCGLVLDSTGKILARSPNYIVQAADLGTTLVFNMVMPAVVSNQTVIVGIAGGQTVSGLNYFLGTSQTEVPMRPNTCFYFMTQAAPGGVTNANVGVTYATPLAWATTRLMMECTVEPLPPVDVGVSASGPNNNIKIPVNLNIPLRAVVKNFGTQTRPSGIQVRYRLNGGPVIGPISTTTSMLSNDTSSVVFSGTNGLTVTTVGTHNLSIYTSLAGDGLIGNDTLNLVLTAVTNNSLPYRIANNILSSWTTIGNTPAIWKQKTAVQSNGASNTNVLYADNIVTFNRQAFLVSPPLNLVGTTNPVLHFNVAHAPNTFAGTDDTLQVMVSTDGGFTFTPLYTKSSLLSSPPLGTDTPTAVSYTPVYASDWRHESVSLIDYIGKPFVTIAFRDKSASGNGIYIGNVSLTNALSHSVQSVSSAGSYTSGLIDVYINGAGATNGEIAITRYNSAPFSSASPVFASNTTTTTNNSSIFTPNNVSQTHWYSVTYSGIGTGNPTSASTYAINLNLTGIPGILSKDSIYLLKRSDFNSPWEPVNTYISGTNLYTGFITGFSDFTIGSVSSINPLPVQFLSFNAQNIDAKHNQLDWITVSELNSAYFIVERSYDQQNYQEIGKVQASGNSNKKIHYAFKDLLDQPFTQTIFYRLKQVDNDGQSSYSVVATVRPDHEKTNTEVTFNNPFEFSPVMWIDHQSGSGEITLQVRDVNGKSCLSKTIKVEQGKTAMRLSEMEPLKQGIYFVEVLEAGQSISVQKILKLN